MFQESEIVNLALGLVGACVVVLLFMRRSVARLGLLYAGFFVLLLALVLTVLEGVMLGELLNVLEHLCLGVSGIMFAMGCVRLLRWPDEDGETDR